MVDRIQVLCQGCRKTLALPQTTAGKRVQCPLCSAVVAVPEATSDSSNGRVKQQQAPKPKAAKPAQQRQARKKQSTAGRTAQGRSQKRKRPSDQHTEELWPDVELSAATAQVASAPLPPKQRKKKKDNSKPVIVGTGNDPPPISRGRKLTFRERLIERGGLIGLLATIGAAVLFFTALAAGVIFYIAPVVFVLGLIKFANAMFDD